MQIPIQLTPQLESIQSKSALVKQIRAGLQEGFGEQLQSLRGNIQLITEMLIAVESLKQPLPTLEEKNLLFFDIYRSCFGHIEPAIEQRMLESILVHLREQGLVYRRTRIGNFIRAILRLFRA